MPVLAPPALNSLDLPKRPAGHARRRRHVRRRGLHGHRRRCWRAPGYDVVGVTLQLYDHGAALPEKGACCAGQDIHDARTAAETLGIPHYVLDYESRFRDAVIEEFADATCAGETPIPCIRCNQTVKFRDLLDVARDLGAEAHGHRPLCPPRRGRARAGAAPRRRPDARPELFPVRHHARAARTSCAFRWAACRRPRRGRCARELGLAVADKPDSQDICFVPQGKYADVIDKLRPQGGRPGDIVHLDGRVLGRHEGVTRYTIGQRKGLNVAAGEPLFVVRIDAETAPGGRRAARGAADRVAER